MTSPSTSGRAARTSRLLSGAPAPAGPDRVPPIGGEGPGAARIAVDLLGGDNAPAVVVDGALQALRADPDLHLLLVGPPEATHGLFAMLGAAERHRVTVRPVQHGIRMADDPRGAARPGNTVRAAVAAVGSGEADAFVSAGSTGASVTAAALELGRWPQVRHPALVATVPAVDGPVVLLDVGGSMEPRPAALAHHALLGSAFAAVGHGVAAPRVGLLSVGTETGKGDPARRAADPLLSALTLPRDGRYVGLVEGYDVCVGGRADVVVTDGFTGNVLLKAIEGAYAMAGGPPAYGSAPRAAALLGVGGTAVVCHGAATAADVASGIALAAHLHRRRAVPVISGLLAELIGSQEVTA